MTWLKNTKKISAPKGVRRWIELVILQAQVDSLLQEVLNNLLGIHHIVHVKDFHRGVRESSGHCHGDNSHTQSHSAHSIGGIASAIDS